MIKLRTLSEFTGSILESYNNGTLILDKHDPNKVLTPIGSFRSVVSPHISSSIERLIKEVNYTVRTYEDSKYPNGAGYYELEFNQGAITEDIGYPVPAGSVLTGSNYDRLVFFSGSYQNWHIASETSSQILQFISSGRLVPGSVLY